MRLSDCGHKVSEIIIRRLNDKFLTIPTEISLKLLEEFTGCRVQNIGMSFELYVKPVLNKHGIEVTKKGNPVVLTLSNKQQAT